MTFHSFTKNNTSSNRIGIQIGLRYKFGSPDPNEQDSLSKPSSFW